MTSTLEPWKIEVVGPLGASIAAYDRSQPPRQQDNSNSGTSSVSPTFLDAMAVRAEVFVVEQGVPLENELDDDDPTCVHFVLYPDTTETTPAGTIRIVPSSEHLHTDFDQHRTLDGQPYEGTVHSTTHNGEPFIKLGRLAIVAAQRGHRYGDALVEAALRYAAAYSSNLVVKDRHSSDQTSNEWRGLVLIHAQVQVQKFWARLGFTLDDGLGIWNEEGIDHVAMWRRIDSVASSLTEDRLRTARYISSGFPIRKQRSRNMFSRWSQHVYYLECYNNYDCIARWEVMGYLEQNNDPSVTDFDGAAEHQ